MLTLVDYDIIQARYKGQFIIELIFRNGKTGKIDFSRYFSQNPVYAPLQADPVLFADFRIENGILSWKNGEIDIAPETIYHDSTGEPYPEWLEA